MAIKGWMRKKLTELRQQSAPYDFSKELKMFNVGRSTALVVLGAGKKPSDINVKYPLIPPFAYAHVFWDPKANNIRYNVIEPHISEREKNIYDKIAAGLEKVLETQLAELEDKAEILGYLKTKTENLVKALGLRLRSGEITKIMYYIYRNFVGLNELEPLLHDEYIEDVGCDGVGIPLYIIHKRYGNLKTNIVFEDGPGLSNFVVKMAERCGRYVSYAEPLLDGSLPDGSRVQATFASDVTTRGPTFSIRKFARTPYSVSSLIKMGTGSAELFAYLWYLIEHGKNILVCGSTAAGKTSLLNSIIVFIPPDEKIVSIEDTRELNILHENWIPAVARQGFGAVAEKKYGEVTMFDLLKESFRQNPDYVIVGEVRGVEASVLFQGMASGHASFSTMHAGSVEEVLQRLQTPPISLQPSLIEALDIVVIIQRVKQLGKDARRVREIQEVVSVDPATGKVNSSSSFQWLPSMDRIERKSSMLLDKIGVEYGVPVTAIKESLTERIKILNWLVKNNVTSFDDVASYIARFYTDHDSLVSEIGMKTYHTGKGIFTNKAYGQTVSLKEPVPAAESTVNESVKVTGADELLAKPEKEKAPEKKARRGKLEIPVFTPRKREQKTVKKQAKKTWEGKNIAK